MQLRNTVVVLFNAIALSSCGTMVAPMDGAAGDGSDARTPSVRFRVQSSTGSSFVIATDTVARVENAMRSMEVRADRDGVVALDLEPGSRWSVTFARPASQIVSIVDFVVPSMPQVFDVFLPPLQSAMPALIPSVTNTRYPTGSTPIHIRGRLRNTAAPAVATARLHAYPYGIDMDQIRENGEFDIVVASFPGAPPLELIAYDTVSSLLLPPGGRPPLRAVIRRLDPRPTTDTTLEMDMAEAVPCPAPTNVSVPFPTEGLLRYDNLIRFDRVSGGVYLSNPFGDYGEFLVSAGEFFAAQDDAARLVNVRHSRVSSLLPFSDERGVLEFGTSTQIGAEPPNHPPLTLSIQTTSQSPPTLSIPRVREVVGEGRSLGEFSFRVDGDFTQFGVELTGSNDQSRTTPFWTVWGYGPPNPSRTEPYRLPRLPEGVSIARLAPTAARFIATTFVSTLPASQPGYGFWRPAAESVRVAHQLELSSAGR